MTNDISTIIGLQDIANLQICDTVKEKGGFRRTNFFCPECHLKFGITSTHQIRISNDNNTFKCPMRQCKAVYSFSFSKKQAMISKIGAYGRINN